MPVRFDCTMCGRCCHNLKLPMSIEESITWLARGGTVQLLTEASVWPGGYDPAPQADYAWQRSVAATSGRVPVRIGVTLVGAFEGACPHLLADMRCGAYEERPGVCRIYPAEINPFAVIDPVRKSCPTEAWSPDQPVFAINQVPVNTETRASIDRARASGISDIEAKVHACALLDIAEAAFANEGLTVHEPSPSLLLAVLRQVSAEPIHAAVPYWHIVTNRSATLGILAAAGTACIMASAGQSFGYHGYFPNDEPLAKAA